MKPVADLVDWSVGQFLLRGRKESVMVDGNGKDNELSLPTGKNQPPLGKQTNQITPQYSQMAYRTIQQSIRNDPAATRILPTIILVDDTQEIGCEDTGKAKAEIVASVSCGESKDSCNSLIELLDHVCRTVAARHAADVQKITKT
jgi:hypothetical protein